MRRRVVSKARTNAKILSSFAWAGVRSLFWVTLSLATLILAERFLRPQFDWLEPLSPQDHSFNIEQLRLYAQLLTAIFSIYFATIGIILSTGYTRLRRDIILLLTSEQVGSIYARVLVFSAMFCLAATALPLLGTEPGFFVFATGTALTLLNALALFPLGNRLFRFFDLNELVRSEILPSIARHVEGAANPDNSMSVANHHSTIARRLFEQMSYIDGRIMADKESLRDNLPALTDDYTRLLLHYLQRKHKIDQNSYWFPRRRKHKEWFFSDDTTTSMALSSSSQQMLVEESTDHNWLENEIVSKLASHIELAFEIGDFELALKLLQRFERRASAYAKQFQFDLAIRELNELRKIIESGFASSQASSGNDNSLLIKTAIADAWAAMGSNLCLESMRRMMTFEPELQQFFQKDIWNKETFRHLPASLQVDLAYVADYLAFERKIEGRRLSGAKYLQQLTVRQVLKRYSTILPQISEYFQSTVPDFITTLVDQKMTEAATQVTLTSLHSYWKMPGWFDQVAGLWGRYLAYEHYTEEQYALPKLNLKEFAEEISSQRDKALAKLGNAEIIKHVFEKQRNEELPDHFGQVYFELAEACVSALERNDDKMLSDVLPMFMTLAFLSLDAKFVDTSLEVSTEYRLHLISSVINDLASILGYAILYAAYFENENLSKDALARFDRMVGRVPDKQQYLERMLLLSDTNNFSMSASPRGLIRINWLLAFEARARQDGYGDRMSFNRGNDHPKAVVREFLKSHSDASHLFFAKHVMPMMDARDCEPHFYISDLASRLGEDDHGNPDEAS